jgi:hypothetical protein
MQQAELAEIRQEVDVYPDMQVVGFPTRHPIIDLSSQLGLLSTRRKSRPFIDAWLIQVTENDGALYF